MRPHHLRVGVQLHVRLPAQRPRRRRRSAGNHEQVRDSLRLANWRLDWTDCEMTHVTRNSRCEDVNVGLRDNVQSTAGNLSISFRLAVDIHLNLVKVINRLAVAVYSASPLFLALYTITICRFGERFRGGQYSLVSFSFAVLLLVVPPVPSHF